MTEKIELIKKIDDSTRLELKPFIGRTLKFIRGEYLSFAFEKPERFTSSKYLQLEFSDRYFVHIIELYATPVFNEFCGDLPALEVKVISKEKETAKLKERTEMIARFKDFYGAIYKPGSTIRFHKHKEYVLDKIIFFGCDKDTTLSSDDDVSERSKGKKIRIDLVEGVIFRFKGNKEIIVRSYGEFERFDVKISNTIDENLPNKYMHAIGGNTKAMLTINRLVTD